MEYFLVKGEIRKRDYMGDATYINDTRLVKANNADEAYAKYTKYWEDKTSEYSVYYSAINIDVTETIL